GFPPRLQPTRSAQWSRCGELLKA
ncbi:uncharacterized protein METZ01_LOCUS274265, partial [marine metagenome]